MESLERTKIDMFNLKDAIFIEELKNIELVNRKIIKIEEIFQDKEKINLDNKKTKLLLNGVKLSVNKKDNIYRLYNEDMFIGIGAINNNLLERDVILI